MVQVILFSAGTLPVANVDGAACKDQHAAHHTAQRKDA